ncbi:MAG: phosphoglycerate kinase [Bacteroidota bacterium]
MSNLLNIPLLQDADLKNKIVLVRVDHNVVKKGIIVDPYRIDMTIGTLFHIVAKGGKIILMTHVGRPKDKKTGEIKIDANSSVKPIVEYIEKKLNIKFGTPEFQQFENKGYAEVGDSLKQSIEELKAGKVDAIYLPNTRWFTGEEAKGEGADKFASQLASFADVYVNDAFGSWQAHASTVAITKYLPSYAGFLMQKELENLDRIFTPKTPLLSIVAGSKFDTKIDSLNALIKTSDYLVLGGVIYNAYLCAKYGIQISGIEADDLEHATKFVEYSKQFPGKLIELPYIIESDVIEGSFEGKTRVHYIKDLKPGTKLNFVLDVAAKSFEVPEVKDVFMKANTIFINAVMGYTPYFNEGTIAMDKLIDSNKNASKLYGGGDTLQELKTLLPGIYMVAIDDPKYYMFTGGGAVLKAIEGGNYYGLEPVKALTKK